MKHIAEIEPGGFITDNFHHHWVRDMIKQRDTAILAIAGDKAIITGVEISGDPEVASSGFVTYNGKIYSFIAGLKQATVTVKRDATDRPNASGIPSAAYYEDIMTFGDDGLETFDFSDLKRVKNLQQILLDETLVNTAPAWDDITDKPTFLMRKVFGKISVGDIGVTSVPSFSGNILSAVMLNNDGDDMRFKVTFDSVGTTNYMPMLQLVSKSANYETDNDVFAMAKNITETSFEILVREVQPINQNLDILIQIIV